MCWLSSVTWPRPNGGPSEREGRPRRVGPALLARQEAVVRAAPACGDPAMALPSSPRTSRCHREHGRRFQPGPIATSVLISSDVPCSPPMTENSCRGSAASAVIFWNAAQSAAVIAARRKRPGRLPASPRLRLPLKRCRCMALRSGRFHDHYRVPTRCVSLLRRVPAAR